MPPDFDVIVLGLGAMGASATYQLARHGAKVLGLDQHSPPHEFGSTHGDTRITRIACGEGAEYAAFAERSHEIWRELEKETGVELLTQNGMLVISGPGERSPSHGVTDFLKGTLDVALERKLKHRILSGREIRERFPAFNVGDGDQAYYDRVSGFVRPERCIAVQLEQARALGATLHLGEKVVDFRQAGGEVTVGTDKGTYRARQLVVAAGPWLPALLGPSLAAPFRITRQVLYWFKAKSAAEHAQFRPDRFPVYIWQVPAPQNIYGFPATGGLDEGVKIATEQDHTTTTPDQVDRSVSADEIREMYETYVQPFFPGLSSECVKAKVCLYTCVDRARFIIDRHPEFERVIVASPCSGHGFKHSGGIGELLAQMALGEAHRDISAFRFARAPTPSVAV
jgi:sarcosine oxidase